MDHSRGLSVCACALVLAVSCGGSAPDKRDAPVGQAAPAATVAAKPEARLQQILAAHEQEWAACLKTSQEQKAILDKMRQALIAGDHKKSDALQGPMDAAGAALRACLEKKAAIVKELQAAGASPAAVEEAWKAFHTKLGGGQDTSPSQ